MDYGKVASDVIAAVGKDNLVAAAHCATRLRLVLKDDTKVDQKALDENPDVKGTFKIDGQYQVIIGAGDVNFVYDELIKKTGLSEVSTDDLKQIANNNGRFNPIMALIKLLSDIFVPIIPGIVLVNVPSPPTTYITFSSFLYSFTISTPLTFSVIYLISYFIFLFLHTSFMFGKISLYFPLPAIALITNIYFITTYFLSKFNTSFFK